MSRTTVSSTVSAAIITAVLAATTAPAIAQTPNVPPKLAAMAAEQFQARAQIIDDHLETETVISTEGGFRHTRGLFKTPWNDNHLRAVIDKRTGAARFEVRQTLKYPGSFRGYGEVNYQTSTWPVSAPLIKVRDNAQNCALFEAGEVCFEEVTFAVDEAHLREIAQRRVSGTPAPWAFKFKAGDAYEHRAAIVQAEIVGLLRAVDDYKRGLTHLDAMAAPSAQAG
ncbi:hypothetical protein [Caulobacter sp. UNC279MFTsu5.1]|uniref:hypothetical protein n=1 Tax=Caulobacter sp. UNC279MFTsu5.1 TaxID=1502775 RepID=UPI0008E8F7B3|nr:hypothetical protein [Caulobacter sp. UNC279MFTsu5.1]SFK04911.1 hypothetical protein SAMN02799626_03264 [Caulobacter sp. UNC279MFTsu5.1]